ncbi:MAG TPA: hypothetical protein VHE56_12370 [Mycobacteriales bacterium]|nr:hypothetical protein [Mycobacteriales bacterium]
MPGRRLTIVMKSLAYATTGALLAAATSCSSSSGGKAHPALTQSPLPDRAAKTAVYAQQLADRAPQVRGETPYTGPVPADLRKPDETIGANELVTRTRYWTAPGTPDRVYRELKRSTAAGLRLTGFGRPSSPAEDVAGRGFVHFDPEDFPSYIAGGELYLEMQAIGHGRTIIAAFAEAFSHPVRIAGEYISAAGATGTARWPKFALNPQRAFGKVVAHPSETLTRQQVASVIDGFNASPVANAPDACIGGLRVSGDELTVDIRSDGHSWVLGYPGTSCYDVSVTRDGVSFPALEPNHALRQVLDFLKHADGTVAGHLLAVGGPSGNGPTPLSGTITLSIGGKAAATVHTRGHGYFLLPAPPGTYTATATSPHYTFNGHPGVCRAEHRVVVATNSRTKADVYCQLK